MSSVKVDYSNLLASASEIETTSLIVKIAIEELPEIRESIESQGKNHDNCFGKISSDIENTLNNIIKKMMNLSNDMRTIVNTFTQAELAMIEGMNIHSQGLENVLKSQYNSTFNEELTGYNYEYYQNLFNKTISKASDERTKSTMAAIFLATSFPHMNYFWGGGHDTICEGLDPT